MADFLPTKDSSILSWSQNFSTVITATPTAFGLLAADATAFAALVTAYGTALSTANVPATRTKVTVMAKDVAKAALEQSCRVLAKRIQAFPSVTPTQKEQLGLPIHSVSPSPVPAPNSAPVLTIVSINSGRHTVRIVDQLTPTKRAKPANTIGAEVFAYLTTGPGVLPPANLDEWTSEGLATRSEFTVEYPDAATGKTAWLVARWQNRKGQTGPNSTPVSAVVLGLSSGLTLPAASPVTAEGSNPAPLSLAA